MQNFCATIIAAGKDIEGLFQILLFIGVAAVYAISGIIKAKAAGKDLKKKEKLQPEDTSTTKRKYRSLDDITAKRRQGTSVTKPAVPYARRESQQKRPPQATTAKTKIPTYDSNSTQLPIKERPMIRRDTAVPKKPPVERYKQVQAGEQKRKYIPQQRPASVRPKKISRPQNEAEAHRIAQIQKAQLEKQIKTAAKSEAKVDDTPPATLLPLSDLSSELRHSQSLARAIIYSEILGKPIGLREHHLQGY